MYIPNNERYGNMVYRRCGKSGIKLPAISVGLWHNFGGINSFENSRLMALKAFDSGITHFDLANNYGPPPGSAEEYFGCILKKDLQPHRDELIISTKAGYVMWDGPYGDGGSKKYLISSLDQSLKRMGLSYVDIFYSHRPDPETPLYETMSALDCAVRSGKALYVGLSNYSAEQTKEAVKILKQLGTPCLIHQPRYSMMSRWCEDGLFNVLEEEGVGSIAYSPLAGGILTGKYQRGIPENSRAAGPSVFLNANGLTDDILSKVEKLMIIAKERGQNMSQMALSWVLRKGCATSVLVGISNINQLIENLGAIDNLDFSDEELKKIDEITK